MSQQWDGNNWSGSNWDANNVRGPNEADTGIRNISADLTGSGGLLATLVAVGLQLIAGGGIDRRRRKKRKKLEEARIAAMLEPAKIPQVAPITLELARQDVAKIHEQVAALPIDDFDDEDELLALYVAMF